MTIQNDSATRKQPSDPTAPERGLELEKSEWEGTPDIEFEEDAIDLLKPGSDTHHRVLDYLLRRLEDSERKMSKFYARWRVQEQKTQAYIDLPAWEEEWKRMNDKGKPPVATSVVIPYQFATISTIVTYLLHTFTGRKPMFQVSSYKSETVKSARMMEQVLQYNADHTRLIRHLYSFIQAGQQYGVGILRTLWEVEKRRRTITTREGEAFVKRRREETTYEGNDIEDVDPFLFFPDPRVPMHEVNRRGEFVFWRSYEGRHLLKRQEAAGILKFVDNASKSLPRNQGGDSARAVMAGGESIPSVQHEDQHRKASETGQIDQGTVEIIPAELGIGDGESPEKWLFTILNKSQIIQAEPFDADHDMHPVAVTEPYAMGKAFGSVGISDYLGPLQDVISWLVNSHQDNVRKVLNDMIVVDPSRVEMQDLRQPGPGKLIRLKPGAAGTDVRTALQQLQLHDVTQQHIRDAELFMRLGQQLSAVTENVLGLQAQGGRKTATEVRTTTEAAASRLAAQARIISAQGLVDLTEQMSVNVQQYLSEPFYLQIVGAKGHEEPLHVSPDQVSGNFYYPVHDGTLPLDKTALFDIWSQMFQIAAQDPEIRQSYSIPDMFEQVAELGGIRNMDSVKLDMAEQEQIQQGLQAGNLVTPDQLVDAFGGGDQPAAPTSSELIGLGGAR